MFSWFQMTWIRTVGIDCVGLCEKPSEKGREMKARTVISHKATLQGYMAFLGCFASFAQTLQFRKGNQEETLQATICKTSSPFSIPVTNSTSRVTLLAFILLISAICYLALRCLCDFTSSPILWSLVLVWHASSFNFEALGRVSLKYFRNKEWRITIARNLYW